MAPAVGDLLAAAVAAVGGTPREGQARMAEAVSSALQTGEHLLVQAGTGTGKSLAYLVPSLAYAVSTRRPVVVSTATLALQAQIVDRDLPRLADAVTGLLGRRPTWQLVKGRRNYLCQHKLAGGFPEEDDALFDAASALTGPVRSDGGSVTFRARPSAAVGRLGAEIVRVREWATRTRSGDRDELVPGVSDRAWRQVSVSAHECLGAQACPMAAECFCERARERARDVDIIVSNHAFVAIDSFEGRSMLPEHDVLVVDEAHELADRVTSVITDELSRPLVEGAARRARRAGVADLDDLERAGEELGAVLLGLPDGRVVGELPEALRAVVALVADAARGALSALGGQGEREAEGARQVARAAVSQVLDVASRLLGEPQERARDVVWVSRATRPDGDVRPVLYVAPLSVAGLLRERLFAERTVILTSATLTLGGSFDAAASSVGLLRRGAFAVPPAREGGDRADDGADDRADDGDAPEPAWSALDVGSPFDYRRQAILYIARHLPPPGREPTGEAAFAELGALVEAAGGRTLGLFSSRRAAEAAAEWLRAHLDVPLFCQGDDATPTLVREFARDPRACLVGTISLWQGVDVPGSSCQLVVIDRIPFPRPDEPLSAARQEALAARGANAFMAISATHAALLLAQGSGRLIRALDDRGVVAVLDSRLATARYASFLRASMPPFWTTTDRELVLQALHRIDVTAPVPVPVADPVDRAEVHGGAAPGPASVRTAMTAGRGWSPEEDAGLKAAAQAGRAVRVIAERYGCTGEQVLARAQALGLDVRADEEVLDV